MILLVGFYQDADPARTSEFIECIRRNCENPSIDRLVVFIEHDASAAELRTRWAEFTHGKVQLIEHGRRLVFGHLFEFANRHFAGALVAIANADIFFDETLGLLDAVPLAGTFLCLSRWDERTDGNPEHYDNPCSQDAWIFEAPIPKIASDFRLGVPGCDNRLAYEAERAGLAVSNPSRSLRARHLHRSTVRRYSQHDRLYGPNRLVPASFLEDFGHEPSWPPAGDFPSHRRRRAESQVNERQQEMIKLLAPYLGGMVPHSLRRELRRVLLSGNVFTNSPDAPMAVVAFRESMGYSLARLELGVSTHNNDLRPLVSVPPTLMGLNFTQVVANHAAPVKIEFRSGGKVFVLAAKGWEGYVPAAKFLDDAGWREPLLELRAQEGTTFNAWSLIAEAGEHLVVPTQVMLAARELARLPL